MSKIVMYSGSTTGTTTTGDQYAFFINENGLPTIKKGSQVISFGTSGYAMQGSSGSSGANGSSGASGTAGVSGTSGQDGAPGSQGLAGTAGSSGVSGSSGINGVDGLNGSSGVSGTNGVDGTFLGSSGSSGASLAKVNEDMMYAENSGYLEVSTGFTRNSVAYAPFSQFGGGPLAIFQYTFDSAVDSFTNVANGYGVTNPVQTFLNGKKLTSIKINRVANTVTPAPTGKTECVTTAVNLVIYKGTIATSGSLSVTSVKTVDISSLINFNVSGSATTATIDLTADNIQTAYNEYIYVQIERSIQPVNSTSKYANMPACNIFFETVTSGILGTNGTAGVSGTNGSSGVSGTAGFSGTAGSSGLSYGSSGTSGSSFNWVGPFDTTGFTQYFVNDVVSYLGSTYICNTGHFSSASFNPSYWDLMTQGGTSGSSGLAGGGGGGSDSFGPDFGSTVLDDTVTNQYGYKYLYGWFGNANHWGFDNARNFEYGFTIPVTVPLNKKLKTVYFPIECDTANTNIPFKFVMWDKKEGTYYPYNYLGQISHTFNFASTGYKLIAFDINFENDGTWTGVDNTYFLSVVANDLSSAMRFRAYVDWYNYDLRGGIFNPSDGQFKGNEIYGINRVYNSSWFETSGIPSIYGPGPGNGYTMGAAFNPVFYSISDII